MLRDERSFLAVSDELPPCLLETVVEADSAELTWWLAPFVRERPLRSDELLRLVAPMESNLSEYLCRPRSP